MLSLHAEQEECEWILCHILRHVDHHGFIGKNRELQRIEKTGYQKK